VRPAGLLVLAALVGCTSKPGPLLRPGGIHIPLPEGWSASPGPDHGLRAGPKGRTVLRVDVRAASEPSQPLPTPLALAEEFSKEGPGLRASIVSEVTEKDLSLVLLEVSKQGSRARALLAVKRMGRELLLCASEPGSGEEEVQAAADACRGLAEGGDT
jgi:hypothetical protein